MAEILSDSIHAGTAGAAFFERTGTPTKVKKIVETLDFSSMLTTGGRVATCVEI